MSSFQRFTKTIYFTECFVLLFPLSDEILTLDL